MKNYFTLLFILGILLIGACGKVDPPDIPPEQGKAYYPLTDIERIYQLDSVTFDLNGNQRVQDTSTGLLRHRMQMIDSNWVIAVSYRKEGTSDWKLQSYISVVRQGREIIENANGAPLRKLIWPIERGSHWEETALVPSNHTITIEGEPVQPFSAPWDVTVTDINGSFVLDSFEFGETLHKEMIEEDLLIEYRKAEEIYAKDIGLVYSYTAILDTQCEHKNNDISNCIDDTWEDKANRGFIAELTLKSWK